MLQKSIVNPLSAPPPVGPYSHAIRIGDLLFCSGQIPLDPSQPQAPIVGDIQTQTLRVLENVRILLADQGLAAANVIKTTVFLTDLGDFAGMNEVYSSFFTQSYPARSTVQVSALPRGAKVEIEVVAHF